MPLTPSPGPIDPDTDTMFGTRISVRPDPPRDSSRRPDAGAASGPNPLIAEATNPPSGGSFDPRR